MDLPFTQQRGQPLIFDFARQAGGFQIFGFDAMPGALLRFDTTGRRHVKKKTSDHQKVAFRKNDLDIS